ncbi:MAG: hypothetical protein QNK85_01835 [Crocinitomicaceae bacterium]
MLKKILIITTVSLYTSLFVGCSQTKLIIKTEFGNHIIKPGTKGAITMKGETYPFKECESICKDCDSLYARSRWEFKGFYNDRLLLHRTLKFDYDTLTNQEFKNKIRDTRWTNFDKLISVGNKPLYIYRIPIKIDTMTVRYSDIETLTFSYKEKCYKGGPIQSIFVNPNKIRKVEMQGAKLQVKTR